MALCPLNEVVMTWTIKLVSWDLLMGTYMGYILL